MKFLQSSCRQRVIFGLVVFSMSFNCVFYDDVFGWKNHAFEFEDGILELSPVFFLILFRQRASDRCLNLKNAIFNVNCGILCYNLASITSLMDHVLPGLFLLFPM